MGGVRGVNERREWGGGGGGGGVNERREWGVRGVNERWERGK